MFEGSGESSGGLSGDRLTLEEWVEKIKTEGLPAFTKTAQTISELAEADEADFGALSKIIMRDAAMTTKLLRASNSAYRLRKGKVNTVSHALVMLGVEEVKQICLTCSFLDGVLDGAPDQGVVDEMSRAFYAATQTRLLALQRGDRRTEELFISALMKSLGPLSFWQVGGEVAEHLKNVLAESKRPPEEDEREILGFTLAELSDALASEWELDKFVPSADSDDPNERRRAQEVRFSTQFARAAERGWDDPVVKDIVNDMTETLSIKEANFYSIVASASQESEETSRFFNIPDPSFHISPPSKNQWGSIDEESKEGADEESSANVDLEFEVFEPDPLFQLKILREVSNLQQEGGESTMLIIRILEGIQRGIGMDRAAFALLNDSRDMLTARLVFGVGNKDLEKDFKFAISPGDSDLFTNMSLTRKSIWYTNAPEDVEEKFTDKIRSVLSSRDFFLAPLVVNEKWIGVFYGDRDPSGRDLDKDSFDAFNQFVFQASVTMSQTGGKF